MCKYVAKENLSKLMLVDVNGDSTNIRTRRKSRLTHGFNVLKIYKDTLYILNLKMTEEEEIYRIYMIKSSAEKLSKLSTTLKGYDKEALKEIIGEEMPKPIAEADTFDHLGLYFAEYPGRCDVAVKRVKELNGKLYVKVFPLIKSKKDSEGNEYYPFGKGNFRDIIELAIKAGEVIEPKNRR